MIGLLFVALLVGPATALLTWSDGAVVALTSASLSASVAVIGVSLAAAYLRPLQPRRWRSHERGAARARFGTEWHAVAHR